MGRDAETPHRPSSSDDRRRRRRSELFPVGSIVEVGTDKEYLRVVYVPATVIPLSSTPGEESEELLHVEYDTLLADGQGYLRLKEYVDVSFVRPTPPSLLPVKGFQPDDVVDALYEDGWWPGVVSRVVEGERVVVMLLNPPEELEFGVSDVRAHWDWVNGIWVKKESVRFTMSMFGVGKIVEISLDKECYKDAWIPARIDQDLGNGVYSVEYYVGEDVRAEVDSNHIRPWPPKTSFLSKKVDVFFDYAWWCGMISKVLDNGRYIVFVKQLKKDKEFDPWDLRPHMEWKDDNWVLASLLVEAQGLIEGETMQVNRVDNEVGVVANEPKRLQACVQKKTTNATSVRETIESMQVFQSIPQKPHFRPLEGLKESLREGLALGYMVAFASLVERCCRLQLNDPKEIIDEIMEALAELEGHGFDVGILQDKLSKLLALKIKQEKFVVEMNNCKDHITEHNHEKTRIEDEIMESNEQMRRLQEKVSIAEETKEKVDNEIVSLQARLKEAEEGVKSVECAFDCMVSSVL